MIKTEKVHNRVYQYQTDTIAAAASNAQLEGFTASAGTAIPTTMISGNTQVLAKIFEVSESAQAVSAHGRASETAYQLSKALREIKRDAEYAMVGASNAASPAMPTAREMDSADQLIASGNSVDAGSNPQTH